MAQLVRRTALIMLLCAIAIVAVKQLGNAQPNPIAEWFTNVDGSPCVLPCLFGIQPGVTSFDEALTNISRHPATHSMQPDHRNNAVTASFGNDHVCLVFWRHNADWVDGMMLSTDDCFSAPRTAPQEVELGQLMTILGVPESVALGKNGVAPDYYFFLSGSLYFLAWNTNHSCAVSPTMSYELLAIGISDSRDLSLPQWKGFARRAKYAQSPDEQANLSKCGH